MLRSRRRAALQAWLERVEAVLDEHASDEGPAGPPRQGGRSAPSDLGPALHEISGAFGHYRLDLGA